uniref:Uncharacterized protein n=1 Tax=Arundo donax TaxID=35708 RepID=A0A0A9AP38_ARUDO
MMRSGSVGLWTCLFGHFTGLSVSFF